MADLRKRGIPQFEISNPKSKKSRTKQRGTSINTEVFRDRLLVCPSCLAVCFTWPQVALTHHVFQLCLYRCAIGLSRQPTARPQTGSQLFGVGSCYSWIAFDPPF